MSLRTQTFILGVAATLVSPFGLALGLGEVKLKSALNQPLSAEIQLQQTRDLTDREILVGLASQADFDRVGVEKPAFLGDLKFRVETRGTGLVVYVTSTRPIVEPYLNFIVQAQWPSGKLLREYTLLVDLPVYSGDAADGVQAAQTNYQAPETAAVQSTISEAPRPARRSASSAARSSNATKPRTTPAAETPMPQTSGDTYGPVATNDTLWKIAKQSRPEGASIQQTMLAIQRLNPEAFVNGNINLLRKGQVLRLPAKDDASQISSEAARQQVAARTGRNPEIPKADDQTSGPQLEASKSISNSDTKAPSVEGRVKLSSSNAAEGSKTGRGTGTDKGNKEALTNELSITKEELDAKSRESGDLKARLKAVDEQIDNTEKLIQVNSEEMRKLELAIEKNRAAAGTPAADGATPTAPVASEVTDLYQTPPEQPPQDPTAQAPGADPSATAPVAPVAGPQEVPPVAGPQEVPPAVGPQEVPPAAPAPANNGLLDLLKANLLFVGAGLGAIVIAGLLLVANRRRKEAQVEQEFGLAGANDKDNGWDLQTSLPAFDAPYTDTVLLPTEPVHEAQVEEKVKLQTDDVVSESDIHIALNDFDTAEKLLLSSLEQDPANTRVLLKLLEIYSRKGDVASFDPQYAKLRSFGDAESIERAEQLRGYIDDAPPFAADQFSDASFLAALNAVTPIEPLSPFAAPLAPNIEAGLTFHPATIEEPQTFDLEFDAVLDEDFQVALDDTQVLPPSDSALDNDDFTLDFGDIDDLSVDPAADRGSLAVVMATSGTDNDLDLSEFEDLNFGKEDVKPSLVVPEEELLSEADYELDEELLDDGLALANVDDSAIDSSLDAGLDDFDLDYKSPANTGVAAEEPDDFADFDLAGLDDDLDLNAVDGSTRTPLDANDDDELDQLSSSVADENGFAALDADSLDFDFDDMDPSAESAESDIDLLNDAEDDKDYAALDFDFSDTDLAMSTRESEKPVEAQLTDLDKTMVLPAVTDADLAAASDLDFDDLDADLGALAQNFEGDFADLDDLDVAEPSVLRSSPLVMDEPITDFGELDDIDPDEVLGSNKVRREVLELDDFDENVTFPLADPQTDLDDPVAHIDVESEDEVAASVLADEDFILDTEDDVLAEDEVLADLRQGSKTDFSTAANLDDIAELDDFVEFEGLDSLDELADAELDLTLDEPMLVDEDDDKLTIPKRTDTYSHNFDIPDFDPESDDDSDLGSLVDGDELATKLDLLRAFVEMGDEDSAKHTLDEILEEGSDEQRKQAEGLFARLA